MTFSTLDQIIGKIQAQPSWQGRRHFLKVLEHWKHVVGDRVAIETQPTGIYRNILHVAASGSTWSQALTFERRRILDKLQHYLVNYPPLEDIHFSTARWETGKKSRVLTPKPQSKSDLFKRHPSYIPPTNVTLFAKKNSPLPPETALEAFQRLANIVKKQTIHLPKCPKCHVPTPPGELERWQICRTCASHLMS